MRSVFGLEALEPRLLLSAAPVVDTFTALPNPAIVGQIVQLTVTAHDPDAGEALTVKFYRDTNGNGQGEDAEIIGQDLDGSDGFAFDWLTKFESPGTFNLLAVAFDPDKTPSSPYPRSMTLNAVPVDHPPMVDTFTALPNPAIVGQIVQLTVTAHDPDAGSGDAVMAVGFFVDYDSDGQATPTEELATDTDGSNGWAIDWNTAIHASGTIALLAVAYDSDFSSGNPKPLSVVLGNLPGDANGDGVVDAADYIALKRAFGSTVAVPGGSPDFDCSGTVDYGDLLVLMGSFGQRSISAPEIPARVALVAPSTTGVVPTTTSDPAVTATEPQPSVPSVDEQAAVAEPEPTVPSSVDKPAAAPAGGILTTAESVKAGVTESTEYAVTPSSPAAAGAVAEPELLPAPVADTSPTDILVMAASVLGNRLVASRQGVPPALARPGNSLPPSLVAGWVGPGPTFPSLLLSLGRACPVVADVLQLAGPWWSGDSPKHEPPDEPWMPKLTVDIAGKPRKGRLDTIELDVLAVRR